MLLGDGIVKHPGRPGEHITGGFEMKRTSRQLCNMSRRTGEEGWRYIKRRRRGGVKRETTLVHFNGI